MYYLQGYRVPMITKLFDRSNCLPVRVGFVSFYIGMEHLVQPTENYGIPTHTVYA